MGYVTMFIYQIVEQKRGKYFLYLKTFVDFLVAKKSN